MEEYPEEWRSPPHRNKSPSVVAALFNSHHLSGDPDTWQQLCSDLDYLKPLLRHSNAKLLLILIHDQSNHDHDDDVITEDRLLALRKRAELDSKFIFVFNPNQQQEQQRQQSLTRLADLLAELANTYYRDEARRIKTRLDKRNLTSPDLTIRYCIKVAVYAEFRRDWAEALRFYEDAYHVLREMIGTATRLPPIQRLVEIKTVAELLHFKISALLLHGGKVVEAVTWFHKHNSSFRKLVGSPEAIFLHWEWMSRQFLVFAELLETSSAALQSFSPLPSVVAERVLTEWEFQPASYYRLAANFMKEKRTCLEISLSMAEGSSDIDSRAESVAPSVYVGQFSRLLKQGDALTIHPLTDEQYIEYAVKEGKRNQDSVEIIALLQKSYESYSKLKAGRIGSLCAFELAKEYYGGDDLTNAKQLFDGVASLYRQEGWVTLLWDVLGYLRECSRKQGMTKGFIEYSLEMAALPIFSNEPLVFKDCGPAGPPSLSQRETICKEVIELVSKEAAVGDLKINGDNPLHLEIDVVSPLRMVLLASVAFHEQIIKHNVPNLITLSLSSQLPLPVEFDQLEVQFNQAECDFVIKNSQRASSGHQQGCRVETSPTLALTGNKWLRLTYDIKSEKSGKLECVSVIAKMGSHFTICCRAESPASMEGLPLWKFEDRVETFPTKDPALSFAGQKAAQVDEPEPLVDLHLGASGPALVGENFIVPVTITSKGHDVNSGELKINLVDVRGGGLFSPRERESFSTENHHVELLGIICGQDDESPDEIKKIQQSFGLVSVPFLKNGGSWSCKLEIKWHRPKPVMLFVSLGYSLNSSNESSSQKVHVHKSLQIEGKTAVVIDHHFLLPFRRDPFLPSRIKSPSLSDNKLESLPVKETSLLVISAKNCTEVPLQLLSISIDDDDDEGKGTPRCSIHDGCGEKLLGPAFLVPGEEFKKIFSVIPNNVDSSKNRFGTVFLKWRRGDSARCKDRSEWVLSTHKLPDGNAELPPLTVSLESPPYAILGDPFTYHVRILNQTQLLQEVKLSLADTQSFVLAGSHSDTLYVLPKSEHILSYKVVALASGLQQLPRFTLNSLRYTAGFQPSSDTHTIFIFPSSPHFNLAAAAD
ncbi:hypothetical protein ACFE04_012297 [Oxalis oulophora]